MLRKTHLGKKKGRMIMGVGLFTLVSDRTGGNGLEVAPVEF